MLLAEASREFQWNLDYGAIAMMWRGGCIIRSRFLGHIKSAYKKNPKLVNLLLDDFFLDAMKNAQVDKISIWGLQVCIRICKNRIPGVKWFPQLSNSAFPCRLSAVLWPSLTGIVLRFSLQICSRHSAITSEPILMNCSDSPGLLCTRTGLARAGAWLPMPIPLDRKRPPVVEDPWLEFYYFTPTHS